MIKREDIQVGAEFNWEDGPELFKVAPELFDFTNCRLVDFQVGGSPPNGGTTKVVVDSLPEGFHKTNELKLQPPKGAIITLDNLEDVLRNYPLFFIELFINSFKYQYNSLEIMPLSDKDGEPVDLSTHFPAYLPWNVTDVLEGFSEDKAKVVHPPLKVQDGTYCLNGKQVVIVSNGKITYN
jgi:hypothetical protein